MVKKENRLRLSRHIKRAYDKGISWRGSLIAIKAFKTSNNQPGKIAVVVSKKFAAHAVVRNLLRRQIKAAFRDQLAGIPGWEVVARPNKIIAKGEFESLKKDVSACVDFLQSGQSASTKKQ